MMPNFSMELAYFINGLLVGIVLGLQMQLKWAVIAILIIANLVLVVSARAADYQLTARWPTGEVVIACSKTAEACRMVGSTTPEGTPAWQPLGLPPIAQATLTCLPRPGCFAERSNHIEGYN